ncbi:MAG: hypothetical protein ABEI07_01550 [Candidatus Nanohaloarchaea archaeon]
MEIKTREPVSPAEVLQKLEEEDELNPSQRRAREFLEKHLAVKDVETSKKLVEELEEMDALKDRHILKIIETLPQSEAEVNALFSKERIKLEDGQVQEIIDFSESVLA